MNGFSKTLRILIKTGVAVSNREASNVFLSYLAYVLGGLFFSSLAIIPVAAGSSKAAANSPLIFVVFVAMFDYMNIQVFLNRTTLTDRSMLSPFPLSWMRSAAYRFILMLLDKRILFYAVPMLSVAVMLSVRGDARQAVMIALLYVALYLVISEMLFTILPAFRRLAVRFSARTAMQIAILPLLLFVFLPGIFHIRHEIVLRIPVVSQFVRGFKYIIASDFVPAAAQVGELVFIALILGGITTAAGLFLQRIGPAVGLSQAGTARLTQRAKAPTASGLPAKESRGKDEVSRAEESSDAASPSAFRTARRLVFLDWEIRQKEERLLYVVIVTPFVALLLAQSIAPALRRPLASVILPIFIVSQLVGIPLIENSYTERGLRLKHISILPMDPAAFVRVKFLAMWLPIVLADLFITVILGLRWGISYYQVIQGVVYSLFIPSVLVGINNTFFLTFSWISRHAIICILVVLIFETLATLVYVLLMLYNFALGLAFVVALFALTYFRWIPAWGRRLSSEFQTLIEESK